MGAKNGSADDSDSQHEDDASPFERIHWVRSGNGEPSRRGQSGIQRVERTASSRHFQEYTRTRSPGK